MEKALNFLYLRKQHSGGKDRFELNLLKGFQDIGVANQYEIICWDYSLQQLKQLAPDAFYRVLKYKENRFRDKHDVLYMLYPNTRFLKKIIKEDNITTLFHTGRVNGLRKLPARVITIPHDIRAVSYRENVSLFMHLTYKVLYAMDFRHADIVIAISDFDKQDIITFYPQYASKVRKIYNPIMTDEYILKKEKAEYICAINLQYKHKNIITLIKAYEIIKDRIPYKLILIGNVPQRVQYLKDYVNQNNLQNDVIFTGFIDDAELNRILMRTALYVNPSLFEGFGMTAVEAMLKQVPTLLSEIPANREVSLGLACYYDDIQNPEALAAAILNCLKNPPTEENLRNVDEAMRLQYDYTVIAKQYHNLLSGKDK